MGKAHELYEVTYKSITQETDNKLQSLKNNIYKQLEALAKQGGILCILDLATMAQEYLGDASLFPFLIKVLEKEGFIVCQYGEEYVPHPNDHTKLVKNTLYVISWM